MSRLKNNLIRHGLPLVISGAALVYVFGFAIDWQAIPQATERANMPLFIAITVFDKILFFLVWCLVQASMIRRFLAPVPTTQIIAVKGGAELARALNNSVSDAAFFLGIWQLCRVPLRSVVAVTTLPFFAHFLVLLLQGSLALAFVPRSFVQFPLMVGAVVFGWTLIAAFVIARRMGAVDRLYTLLHLDWLENRIKLRDLWPYVGVFAAFAVADILIQGAATRAFGNPIDLISLTAGIPALYLMMLLPSFGNFGPREIVWANLFHGYGDEVSLYAFALWTNVIFLSMHVLIGTLFLKRAIKLLSELRKNPLGSEAVRHPVLRDALDP
ncbi:MAG: hypothetical protein VCB25_11230 [Myxococcota bacterium]